MAVVITLLVLILGFFAYMVKLNHDLLVNKDNILRSMAAFDAMIIKKNEALLDLIGYAQEVMVKESYLIKDILNLRHEITEIKPKIVNAPARYQKQAALDKQIEQLLSAVSRYSDLGKNSAFQVSLQKFNNIDNEYKEKVEFYNTCVDRLNWSINSFPSSIIAQMANTKEPPPKYN